jgi:hypothetical protein
MQDVNNYNKTSENIFDKVSTWNFNTKWKYYLKISAAIYFVYRHKQ